MKATQKKVQRKTKSKKVPKAKKSIAKIKLAPVIKDSLIPNTAGARMPNPAAKNRPIRKDVRFAFR